MSVSGIAGMLRRLDKLEGAMGEARICVLSGPFGGDFTAAIANEVSAGRARKTDFFVYVNRFCTEEAKETSDA